LISSLRDWLRTALSFVREDAGWAAFVLFLTWCLVSGAVGFALATYMILGLITSAITTGLSRETLILVVFALSLPVSVGIGYASSSTLWARRFSKKNRQWMTACGRRLAVVDVAIGKLEKQQILAELGRADSERLAALERWMLAMKHALPELHHDALIFLGRDSFEPGVLDDLVASIMKHPDDENGLPKGLLALADSEKSRDSSS
jgi:hypothetical protein